MMKVDVRDVRVNVTARYYREGSVLAGTIKSGCESVHTEVHLESDEPPARVAELIRVAEASCFTMGALRNPTPCELTAVMNGEPLPIEQSGG
jgi:hypothetical protein